MVSSLLTLHLEQATSRLGGPAAGGLSHFKYILCIFEVLSPMVSEGTF